MRLRVTVFAGVLALTVIAPISVRTAAATSSGGTVKADQKDVTSSQSKTSQSTSSAEQIRWQVSPAAGTFSSSADYKLRGAAGQTAVGRTSAADYAVSQGFWQSFGALTCCVGAIRGNIDNDPDDQVDISDVIALIDYMFTGGPAPVCFYEADLNPDWVVEINIADLIYLVDYLFQGGPPPAACP